MPRLYSRHLELGGEQYKALARAWTDAKLNKGSNDGGIHKMIR
jgi:hypothetical protein